MLVRIGNVTSFNSCGYQLVRWRRRVFGGTCSWLLMSGRVSPNSIAQFQGLADKNRRVFFVGNIFGEFVFVI
jgi:hypothetical protein